MTKTLMLRSPRILYHTLSPNKPLKSLSLSLSLALRLSSISFRLGRMVWFQCEDCGENLKKPKLPNHFRICSATKLSCIDCGEIFGQQSVQAHTQCITEAEKYGPKGQAKVANGRSAKPNNDKPKPDFDVNVGLSERPPWFCRLCNTQATSKQTLFLHAEGKKHRAKARAFHAANQAKPAEEPSETTIKESVEDTPKIDNLDLLDRKGNGEGQTGCDNSQVENGNSVVKKKRKIDASEADGATKNTASDTVAEELGSGEVIQVQEAREQMAKEKKARHHREENGGTKAGKDDVLKEDERVECGTRKGGSGQKIKLKKLITSTLRSTSEGVLKMRKLQKLVMKTLQDSGIIVDDAELRNTLEQKVSSSSKFTVDGKYVHLVAKQ
ncbi:hypothetical protein Ancab_027523 [Ancistrocladus abbreviatus]